MILRSLHRTSSKLSNDIFRVEVGLMTKISIALCTYNGEAFLREQLRSISDQTLLPDEIIVCDDNSSDRTCELISDFAAAVPFRVSLFQNPTNLGSTKNFEKAISLCSGDIIFLCDQDDVWIPEKIEIIEAQFKINPEVGLIFSDAELVSEDLLSLNKNLWDFTFPRRVRRKARTDQFYKILLSRNVVTGATAAFRSSFIPDFVPIPNHMSALIHDGWIALVISVAAEIVFLDMPLIKYRQHPGQQLGINHQLGINNGFEKSGTMRERYSDAVKYLNSRKMLIENFRNILDDYPALRHEGKIEHVLASDALEIYENITHLENRIKLFDKTAGRLPIIFHELVSGRYHRFSKGLRSALKDIVART